MIFEQHYLDCLSQASYFIGDETTKRAVVIDPRRDISPYLETASEHGMTIELVIETHFHADFLSGHLEVAEATGADVAYGDVAQTEFPSRKLADGERIELGEVVLEVRHTPGHTPESISVVVFEHRDSSVPYGVLTGDTLFVGDVGRPDLLSSKGVTSEELASDLYDSLQDKLLTLADEVRVFPAHGAGSACGKNLSSETSSTIGQERATNYALAPMSRHAFIAAVSEGQTAPPAYFAFDAMLNRELRPLLEEGTPPAALDLSDLLAHHEDGAVILDARDPEVFATGHLTGSLNIGLAGRFAEFAGAIIDPAANIVLVAEPGTETDARNRLGRIGFDNVLGYLVDPVTAFTASPEFVKTGSRIDASTLADVMMGLEDLQLVDIRQPSETEGGIIDGATAVPLTRLNDELAGLDPMKPTVVYCAGGYRSSIAASKLSAAGFDDVSDLLGGYGAWQGSAGAADLNS